MAKYEITMSCGHTEVKELFGKTADRKNKIRYFEEQGLCLECYKKRKQEEAKSEGLVFNVSVLPYVDQTDGGILLQVYFSGDTIPYKDDIKSLGGYTWSREEVSGLGPISTNRPVLCWNKIIKLEDFEKEIARVDSIGATNKTFKPDLFATANYQIALKAQEKWGKNQEKIAALNKPVLPKVLEGTKWNQKIYGKPGNYSIYPNGEKTEITDEQAEEIRTYLAAKEEYKNRLRELENIC